MRSTITDIARAAKVSAGSVSSVLNNKAGARRISKATVDRVRRVAGELGYVPNYCAQGLRTQQTHNIGLLVDLSIHHFYLIDVITQIEKHARARGYHVNIGMLHDEEDTLHYIKSFGAGRCDVVMGISITLNDKLDKQFKELESQGVPVVLVYSGVQSGYDCVCPDSRLGAIMAGEYLVSKGHRCIVDVEHARVIDPDGEDISGYREVLRRHGMAFNPSLIYECPGDFECARQLWKKIRSEVPECTGIITCNDDIALGLARGAKESGLRIPEDITIVARNNTYPVRIAEVPLASTQYDLDLVAELAVQIVLDRLEMTEATPTRRSCRVERVSPTLVER